MGLRQPALRERGVAPNTMLPGPFSRGGDRTISCLNYDGPDYSNCSSTISGLVPTRRGGPHVPAP